MFERRRSSNKRKVEGADSLDIIRDIPSDPRLQPLPEELLRRKNIGEDGPEEIDITKLPDLLSEQDGGLAAIIKAGNSVFGVYGTKVDGKFIAGAPVRVAPIAERTSTLSDGSPSAAGSTPVFVHPEQVVEFGRRGEIAAQLGISEDHSVSRAHFEIELSTTGKVIITDIASVNGTQVTSGREVSAQPEIRDSSHGAASRVMGRTATQHEVDLPLAPNERIIEGGIKVSLQGAISAHGRDAYALKTTQGGQERHMFVYHSASEGTWRVSQGIIKTPVGNGGGSKETFLKGAPHNKRSQYTQDTQLHPSFLAVVNEMAQDSSAVAGKTHLILSPAEADVASEDFQSQVAVTDFPGEKVANALSKLSAGGLARSEMSRGLDLQAYDTIERRLPEYIRDLNKSLKDSDIIPDFRQEGEWNTDVHAKLGVITREAVTHQVGGVTYEWHMASDIKGRVWIDRIRIADSKPTAYGTDQEMVFSGILTSKPLDYSSQTTGLPEGMFEKFDLNYDDISLFLDQLAPIAQYRQARGITRRV